MSSAKVVAVATSAVMASFYLLVNLASASGFPICKTCTETARINKQRPGTYSCPVYAPDPAIKFDCVRYSCLDGKYSWVTEQKGTVCQWGVTDDGDCPPGRTCFWPTEIPVMD